MLLDRLFSMLVSIAHIPSDNIGMKWVIDFQETINFFKHIYVIITLI